MEVMEARERLPKETKGKAKEKDQAWDEVQSVLNKEEVEGGKKKRPQPPTPAKQQKPGKGEQRPQDCFRCGSLEHFSRQCRAPKEVVAAYKARKEHETHLALVQEQSPLAPPAAPVMIATPPPSPLVATSVVPIAAALAVSNDADVAMEVEHTVAPTGPPLDVDAATNMMTIEEGLTSLEIQAELDGFFAESI
ncbi:hypothetical protein D1007_14231 [Hordeum vulgare]|nr:hypothetical protein D1007_14231 [Hordeum vulgare]